MTERVSFVCPEVFQNAKPVLLVVHESEDWMFLCGMVHPEKSEPSVVGMNHLLSRDPTLVAVLDLPDGWEAERNAVGSEWRRSECDPDER